MTTEEILADLRQQLEAALAAGRSSDERDVRQQIVAHETLTRLRAEHSAHPSDGLASQIRSWQRKVWRDADPQPAPKPKRQRSTVAEQPAELDTE